MDKPHLPIPLRLLPRQKKALYLSLGALWLSGALWLLYHYFLAVNGPFGPMPNPLEQWWLRLHGLSLLIALLAVGSVLPHHAHRAWTLKRNRLLGLGLLSVLAWLALTGYALYYFATDSNQRWLPLLHWVPGLALPLLLLMHVVQGRKRATPAHHHATQQNLASTTREILPQTD